MMSGVSGGSLHDQDGYPIGFKDSQREIGDELTQDNRYKVDLDEYNNEQEQY